MRRRGEWFRNRAGKMDFESYANLPVSHALSCRCEAILFPFDFLPPFPSCWVQAGIGANFLQRVTDPQLGEPTRGELALVTRPRQDEDSGNRYRGS